MIGEMQVQFMPTVAEVLTALMRLENLSDNQLSDKTGIPQPTISRIKSGESLDPRDRTLRPLAAYFGLTVSQMRGDVSLPDHPQAKEPSNILPGLPSPSLTPSEREMVELIRGLTPEQQSDFKQALEDTQRKNKAIFEALSRQFKSVEEGDEK